MTQLTMFDAPQEMIHLWVNIADLDAMGTIPGFGTPLNFMISPELGDERLPGGYIHKSDLDSVFIIIRCTPDRAAAITAALAALGHRKIKRAVRTRQTANLPAKGWTYFSK